MQLGAQGVLELMNSMGGLSSASKFWSPGDKVVYVFPVNHDADGNPSIPTAYKFGHNVDLGDNFKRSFIPSKATMDPITQQVTEPDFAFQTASIFRALLEGEKARKKATIERENENENARKIELDNLETDMKKRFPAVGGISVKAYSEVAVLKLDTNNRIIGDLGSIDYGSINISKKKLGQLLQCFQAQGAYIPGSNYFYVQMQTTPGKKEEAGRVDWTAITEESRKLENLHPDFAEKITALFQQKSPTEETIAAKIYDFRDYDIEQFKSAVANYVNDRKFYLKDHAGNYHDFVRNKRNVESLTSLGLIADADEIKAYLKDEDEATGANIEPEEEVGNVAQTLDVSAIG